MPGVLLSGLSAADPAGSRAVRDAVAGGLPNHQPRDMGAYPDAPARLSAARHAAAVIVTGTPFPWTGASAAAMAAMAGRPLIVLGAASGPLPGPAAHLAVRRTVRQARLLVLADEQSAGHLAAAGAPTPLRVGADPAWLGVADVVADTVAGGVRGESVAVALDGSIAPPVERALVDALVTIAGTGRRIRLVPWHPADRPMASRLARMVRLANSGGAEIEPQPETLGEAAACFAGAHAVVAFRHRAVHAAAAASVPVVGIATDWRASGLAVHLGQHAVAPFELPRALPVTLERLGPAATPDRAAVRDEIERALAAMRLLRLVVEPDAVPAVEVDRLPLVPVPWL